jgi:gamma-glutamyltranspeptidase / glutathione hydrolase
MVSPGVAAGHPATAAAGIEILEDGGTAADAVVAASLASCVAETVMTGLAGGGHALSWRDGRAEAIDCFVAVPGLGAPRREVELLRLEVPFGTELVHYAVGIGSCGVPGVPAGLEALASGRLSWRRLVEPALRLAHDGVGLPPAHASCLAMLAPVMTMNEGARIYAPNGTLLEAGETLRQPGLVRVLELIADEGPRTFYDGTLADELLRLMDERGGPVRRTDLREYRVLRFQPRTFVYRGCTFHAGGGPCHAFTTCSHAFPFCAGRAKLPARSHSRRRFAADRRAAAETRRTCARSMLPAMPVC